MNPSISNEIIYEKTIDSYGQVTIRRSYLKGKFLGKGGFARCYELICQETGRKYAGKIVQKNTLVKPKAIQKFKTEIKIHKSVDHPRIVKFLHFFEDDVNFYILLELCSNHSLSELMRRRKQLTEPEVRYFLHQLLEGVEYLHQNNIIHRDLKLGKVFLSSKVQVKLGDFGLAAKVMDKDDRKKTICGTPNYIAPEIISGKTGHSFEVDIWSLGVMVYTLLYGKPPYEAPDVKATYRRIKSNTYSFPAHTTISSDAKQLISDILQSNPAERLTIDQIRKHPFFTNSTTPIPESLSMSTFSLPATTKGLAPRPPLGNLDNRLDFSGKKETEKRPAIPLPNESEKMIATKPPASKSSFSPRKKIASPTKVQIEATYDALVRCLGQDDLNVQMDAMHLNTDEAPSPLIWISQWVDYTSRYGMGYILSNNHAGVYFNDSTKIILNQGTNEFDYIQRTSRKSTNGKLTSKSSRHTLSKYEPEMHKKVTLLIHFQDYLVKHSEKSKKENTDPLHAYLLEAPTPKETAGTSMTYVRKWMKTRHAVLFCLTNGCIQINYHDGTRLMLSENGSYCTFINKQAECRSMRTSIAIASSPANICGRLTYMKDILQQMIHPTSSPNTRRS